MSKFLDTLKELQVSPNLVHKVVVAEEANARQGTQSAKTRSETRGGGRKPYKQKKTGNARQGTIRAPHYAHGGMALAVKPRDYSKKVNKKERRLAMLGAIADAQASGNLILVDKIAFAKPSTKDAAAFLAKNGAGDVKRVLVIVSEFDDATVKSFRNLPMVEIRTAPRRDGQGEGFSTRDVVLANKIVMTKDAVSTLEATYSASEEPAPKKAKAEPAPKKAPAKAKKSAGEAPAPQTEVEA